MSRALVAIYMFGTGITFGWATFTWNDLRRYPYDEGHRQNARLAARIAVTAPFWPLTLLVLLLMLARGLGRLIGRLSLAAYRSDDDWD